MKTQDQSSQKNSLLICSRVATSKHPHTAPEDPLKNEITLKGISPLDISFSDDVNYVTLSFTGEVDIMIDSKLWDEFKRQEKKSSA